MKRIGNLYDKIISLDNLRRAHYEACRGKRHRASVKEFEADLEANLLALFDELLLQTYRMAPYEVRTICKKKKRVIFVLTDYRDAVVHHAIALVLRPLWVRSFPYNTYSCIRGRGIKGAHDRVAKILRDVENSRYCLKTDFAKYYPSIDHDVMKATNRRLFKDRRLLWLLDMQIDSINGYPSPVEEGKVCQGKGITVGGFLSPFFANDYLSRTIHGINENRRVKGAVYADDGVFFAADKEELRHLLAHLNQTSRDDLKLCLKSNYQIFPVARNRYDRSGRGVDFVGTVFYHGQQLMRKSIKQNFCRTARRLNRRRDISIKEYKGRISGWLGWAKQSNSRHLLKTIIKPEFQHGIL